MESCLTIQEVAKRTGLTAYTLRYYERIGLIAPIARANGGQRRYANSDMDWLAFLMRLRATDMPIHRMQEFARLRSEGNSTATERRNMLEGHLIAVTAKIQELQNCAQVLTAKIEFYRKLVQFPSQGTPPVKENEHDTKPLRTRTRQT